MGWLENINYLLRMGCVCSKESLSINNRRYYVKSRLGEGGFSYVDLVEDSHRHKQFALKRITCHSKEDEREAVLEAEWHSRFRHPNLLPCEDFCVVDINDPRRSVVSEVLVLMPFFRKGTIQDVIDQMVKKLEYIPEMRIWQLFRGICEGVRVLHQQDSPVAHRDLKPANVLLGEDDTPVLMDFGSMAVARVEINGASQARALTDIAAERCTMPYRAPELFNVESYCKIDEKTDIWSLGCVLYAMAFLESPFEQAYQRGGSIALAVMSKSYKIPQDTVYSEELTGLIGTLMTVNPMERCDIDSVIQAVENIINKLENRI